MHIVPANPEGIALALKALSQGQVIAHATETCYGLACDLRNADAVKRLFAIKDRPQTQPVSALFSSVEHAKQYVEWNTQAENLAKEHLPGPLTLILPLRSDAPTPLYPTPSGGASLGVRISSYPLAMELAAQFGAPMSTTSANVHGLQSPYSVEQITTQYQNRNSTPDLILDSGALKKRDPSRIIDLSSGSERLVRP